MKRIIQQTFAVVETESGSDYAERINRFLADPTLQNVKIEHRDRSNFCAYITYEKVHEEPENARDEYELMGISFSCGDCPFRIHNDDKRVKRFRCDRAEESGQSMVYKTEPACPYFYEALKAGEISQVLNI